MVRCHPKVDIDVALKFNSARIMTSSARINSLFEYCFPVWKHCFINSTLYEYNFWVDLEDRKHLPKKKIL